MATRAKKKNEEVSIDRTYVLTGDNTPMQFMLRNRHKAKSPLQYYNEDTGVLRTLRYATNHNSVFEDEQQGDITLGYIVFKNGKLFVPKSNPTLQEFLKFHPLRDKIFEEFQPEKKAEEQLSLLEIELQATSLAFGMEADELESMALAIWGRKVLTMKTSEIKRDVFVYSRSNPESFMNLAADDLTKLKGLGVRAVSMNLLTYKNQAFYNGTTLVCKMPLDETDEYNTLARYMKTEDGSKLLEFLNSKLK